MMKFREIAVGLALFLAACSGGTAEIDGPEQSAYFKASDQIIGLKGQMVRYRETGPADAAPVIMLHGFTDSLQTWDALADNLDDEFRVLRPDLPGHGLSGPNPSDDYSNDALVDFVGAFQDAVGVDRAIIVGNSLGGLAAWRFAATHADRVSGLVLLAPSGVPHNGVGDEPLPVPAMLKFYLKGAPEAGVKAAMQAMYADPSKVTEARITEYRDMMKEGGHGEAFVARAAAFTLPDPSEDLARIAVPTTVIWGAQDVVLPAAHADVYANNIAGSEIIVLEDVGHLPQAEATDQVADAIRRVASATPTDMSGN